MDQVVGQSSSNFIGSHEVRFYRQLDFLAQEVAGHLAKGLRQGDSALAIMRPALSRKVADQLFSHGLARLSQNLIVLDAQQTLDAFMVEGWPDTARFRATIEPHLVRCTAEGRHVSAFGEMVALLCDQGHYDAAVKLEQLWNELQREYPFALLCAYPLRLFSGDGTTQAFRHICLAHGHVAPTELAEPAGSDAHSLALAQLEQKTLAYEELSARYQALLEGIQQSLGPEHHQASEQHGRVLVVHENRATADYLAEMMTTTGWEARVAGNASEALQLLQEFTPDTAMLQIGAADGGGHVLARRLRERLEPGVCRFIGLVQQVPSDDQKYPEFEAYLVGLKAL